MGRAFSARRVAGLRAAVERICGELLDRFAEATSAGGAANFQALVGYPLPVAVVGELIGVPRAEQAQFQQLGQDASRLLEPVRTAEDWERSDRAVLALREYFTTLLDARRSRPADDLASDLLAQNSQSPSPERELTNGELVDILLLVFVAGFETTTGLLGLTVFALLTHPDQRALLDADPSLVTAAVEESLRWDGPVLLTERIAARTVEVGGVKLDEGSSVTAVLAAANRDPERNHDPDAFLVRRPDIGLLSFSAGPHYCLGAALARLEGASLLGPLFARFPKLALAGEPGRRDSVNLRSFDNLPLSTGR
ncbi:cytochrome P450 [Streptacidiphilus sp. 4-A2]|nr:cytochrome P450 [Streptacidiphilus sp. 4-A2]